MPYKSIEIRIRKEDSINKVKFEQYIAGECPLAKKKKPKQSTAFEKKFVTILKIEQPMNIYKE